MAKQDKKEQKQEKEAKTEATAKIVKKQEEKAEKKSWKKGKGKQEEQEREEKKVESEKLVRIMSTDIPGEKNIYAGLTRIKGVSWSFSNAICKILNIDKKRKILDLSKQEIEKINDFIKQPKMPFFLLNRKFDMESGENKHLTGSGLDLRKEFDIKRLRQIRSYRGLRHATGQPVRGQRTRGHFRENKAVGVMKKAKVGKKT